MNWVLNVDSNGAVAGMRTTHPQDPPHPLSTGWAERKQRAVHALGVVSRNDVHLDHGIGGQPWRPVKFAGFPSVERNPVRGEPMSFNREQMPAEWHALEMAPDNSRYALDNRGLLGDAIVALFSYTK